MWLRFAGAACLLAIAAGAGMLAWGALSNLSADYQDSPTSTYLGIGIPAAVCCLGALFGAVRIVRHR